MFYDYLDFLRALPEGEVRGGLAERIFSLPNRYGGLGVLSMAESLIPATTAAYQLAIRVLLDRGLTSEDELTALSEQMVAEGRRNRYSQNGPTPGVAEENRGDVFVKQGALMEKKFKVVYQALIDLLDDEQRIQFVDNKGGME